MSSKARDALAAGEHLVGHFWPSGSDFAAPGFLSWSHDDGVTVELIVEDEGPQWPALGADHQFVMHARTDTGDDLTVPDAWIKTTTGFDHAARRVRGLTLLLGEHTEHDRRWPTVFYGTANLSEWVGETGLRGPSHDGNSIAVTWTRPVPQPLRLPGAQGALIGRADPGAASVAPRRSITTSHNVRLDPDRPRSAAELHRHYAMPLLAFTAFAADRPDALTFEVVLDRDAQQRCEIWRTRTEITPRDWDPSRGFLFRAGDVRDVPRALRRWYRLYEEVRPALDLFGGHIQEGSSYSPARFLGLFTAMEGYCRARHGQQNFRRLREYARVPDAVHGCSNAALALMGQTRKYLAHLRHDGTFTEDQIIDSVFASTRRASALMQCCLLRALGFGHRQVERLVNHYYGNWPIPTLP
jgi:hypothetical protein